MDRTTRSLGFLAESHDFVLLKRNGPSLRTLAEPEAEVKVVKHCFNKKKKKKVFIQINPTSAGQFVFQYLDTNYRRAQVQLGCSTRRWNPRIQPQIWMMASWNSRPQKQLQLPAQGLVKWNPRLQQRHLQSWYLEKHSLSPRKSLRLQEKPGAPGAPVASLEPNRNAAGGPRKQSLTARGQLKLRTFKLFL